MTKYSYKRPWWWPWNWRIVWQIWSIKAIIRYSVTGDCGNACGYIHSYGWVPEAGCPIHDLEG